MSSPSLCMDIPSALLRPKCNRPSRLFPATGGGCRRRLGLPLAMALAMASAGAAQSLTFPATPVGTASSAVTVTVTFQTDGEVHKVKVLTLGAEGKDFAAGFGASCQAAERFASQTCQQSVVFTPAAPGLRLGAVMLVGDDGSVLGTTWLSGLGQGGLGVLVPGNTITAAGSYRLYTSTQGRPSGHLGQPLGAVQRCIRRGRQHVCRGHHAQQDPRGEPAGQPGHSRNHRHLLRVRGTPAFPAMAAVRRMPT